MADQIDNIACSGDINVIGADNIEHEILPGQATNLGGIGGETARGLPENIVIDEGNQQITGLTDEQIGEVNEGPFCTTYRPWAFWLKLKLLAWEIQKLWCAVNSELQTASPVVIEPIYTRAKGIGETSFDEFGNLIDWTFTNTNSHAVKITIGGTIGASVVISARSPQVGVFGAGAGTIIQVIGGAYGENIRYDYNSGASGDISVDGDTAGGVVSYESTVWLPAGESVRFRSYEIGREMAGVDATLHVFTASKFVVERSSI